MSQAKNGDTVKVHYIGTFDDGEQFDSSVGDEPLEFKMGEGNMIPGFEKGVEGMAVGEKKTIRIPADEAYGEHNPQLIQEVQRSEIPDEIELAVGVELQAQGPDGDTYVLAVTEVNEDTIIVDGNHPMVGKDLNFELEMVEIG